MGEPATRMYGSAKNMQVLQNRCQQPKNQPTPRRTELRHGAFLVDAELHWELHWELYWDPGRTQGRGERAAGEAKLSKAKQS